MSDRELGGRLKRAVMSGDLTTARRLVKGGVALTATFWFDGTLLQEAVASGHPEMVRLLLQANCGVNTADKAGQTALHLACRRGNLAVAKLLLDHGADINAATKSGRSPLHVATWREHEELAGHLVTVGANTNSQDEDGWTSLHWACARNHTTLASTMIDHGAKVNIRNKAGETPLYQALHKVPALRLICLLLRSGADPNIASKTSSTLGRVVTSSGDERVARLLLNCGFQAHTNLTLRKHISTGPLQSLLSRVCGVIPSLAALCRQQLRAHLGTLHSGRPLSEVVGLLPLPALMVDYVLLTDELADDT